MNHSHNDFTVYLGGIPRNTRGEDVKDWIKAAGPPEPNSVWIGRDQITGRSRGYCFVYAKNETDGRALIQGFNGAAFPDGTTIRAGVEKFDGGGASHG